jgi:hypothetical protein
MHHFCYRAKLRHPCCGENENGRHQQPDGGCHLDLVTVTVVGIIIVSYVVGCLTSSVETEKKLPHRY